MKFYSLRNRSSAVSAREAVLNGLAPDGGLYMPQSLPLLPSGFLSSLKDNSFAEIAFEIAKLYFGDDVDAENLFKIVQRVTAIEAPVVRLSAEKFVLELFHGPTMAFKDFGACFMAELMSFLRQGSTKELVILTATSGDTGSAVGRAFLGRDGIRVFILYPSGKVSHLQEQQLTTLGGNVSAVEIDGTFDDCQRLVKTAFSDTDLKNRLDLSSANSINIARLIPQCFYYLHAAVQLANLLEKKKPRLLFSVPSGNLGNITAGIFAQKSSRHPWRFVAAANANDVLPRYLKTGKFQPSPSIVTLSNAMDVGDPSNFPRMTAVYQGSAAAMREDVSGSSFSDEETLSAISRVFAEHNYLLDPHGAVACLGLEHELKKNSYDAGCCLETAHPAKFLEVAAMAKIPLPPIPERLQATLNRKKESTCLSASFAHLKDLLLSD